MHRHCIAVISQLSCLGSTCNIDNIYKLLTSDCSCLAAFAGLIPTPHLKMSKHPENFSAPPQSPDPPGNVGLLSICYSTYQIVCISASCILFVKTVPPCMRLQEHEMKPQPDYGFDSYKGSGKLKNKVGAPITIHFHQKHESIQYCCSSVFLSVRRS